MVDEKTVFSTGIKEVCEKEADAIMRAFHNADKAYRDQYIILTLAVGSLECSSVSR
ncbi:MAG: hypothetical protein GX280_09185 [Lentisphaerae bacterium]|nr:hypothetical protein [Lentisphaerota bacterium]